MVAVAGQAYVTVTATVVLAVQPLNQKRDEPEFSGKQFYHRRMIGIGGSFYYNGFGFNQHQSTQSAKNKLVSRVP